MSKSFNDKGWKIIENGNKIEIRNNFYSNFFVYEKEIGVIKTDYIFSDLPENFIIEDIFKVLMSNFTQ